LYSIAHVMCKSSVQICLATLIYSPLPQARLCFSLPLYLNLITMERTPDTPNALIDARHRLVHPLDLLTACVSESFRLITYTFTRQIPHADGPLGAVDVVCSYHWMLSWSGRDGNLYLGVALCKRWEGGLEEGVHAARGAGPVAVVEFEPLALEDEGADAVL
jgi:hypothetical protein